MSNSPTLQSAADEYIANNSRIRSEDSIRHIKGAIRHFCASLGREALLSDLTDKNLVAYIRYRESLGIRPATLQGECNKIMAVWRWYARHGQIAAPNVCAPAVSLPSPEAWSKKEIARILKAAWKMDKTICGAPRGIYFYSLLLLVYETGERVGAVRQLRWSDVDFDNRWVLYRGATRKGTSADNRQRISRRLSKALWKLSLADPGQICPFGNCYYGVLYYHLKQIHQAAGLPHSRNSMFHRMRRSHATHLYAAGGDATVSLGHSSDYITRKRYLDPRYIRKTFGADLLYGPLSRLVNRLRNAIGI